MAESERGRFRRMRKEYIRQERASIRRERMMMRKRIREARSMARKAWIMHLWEWILGLFVFSPDRTENKRKIRQARNRYKSYAREERESEKRQQRTMVAKTRPLRKEIRREQFIYFARHVVMLFQRPAKRKKMSENQLLIRKQFRFERRRAFYQQLSGIPFNFMLSIGRFWRKRYLRIAHIIDRIADFLVKSREISRIRDLRVNYLATALSSSVFFILTFLMVYIMNQYITIYTARIFDIPTVLYSYRIYWPLYTYSTLYTRSALILIFGLGPFVSLVLAIVFFRIFIIVKHRSYYLNTFLFWLVIHLFNSFFGAYIVGVVTRTGFIYTSEWLFLSNVFDVEEIIFMIISFVILIILGYYGTKHILTIAANQEILESRYRVFYIINKALVPVIIGTTVLFFMNFPNNPAELILYYSTVILVIIPMFTNYNSMQNSDIRPIRNDNRPHFGWMYLAITIIAVVLFRIIFEEGISYV
jgi:hypothetical protein